MGHANKIAINPERLQWCCDIFGINSRELHADIDIAESTFKKAIDGKEVLSVNQLEKLAKFFNRSLLFFINSNPVNNSLVYSPQFRTINNEKPLRSIKINALLEHVEGHRKVYLNLLNDLDEPITNNWHPQIDSNNSTKQNANHVREWLDIKDNLTFDELRALVESKGIMVFVSSGYNGKWQIDKDSPVRGFALYYEPLPIIVIKKQISKSAQAFTLMHELAHLLLDKTSMIDNNEDFYSYQGKEQDANVFASNVLIPDDFLTSIDINKLSTLEVIEYDNYLKDFKKRWCVSGDAILYRLLQENKIDRTTYQNYRNFKEQQYQARLAEASPSIPRSYRHREPINIFGRSYVATVLNARQNKHITLSKASTYLDNLKIHTLHKLEREFV